VVREGAVIADRSARVVTLRPSDVPDGSAAIVKVDDELTLSVYRVDDIYYAIDDRCPHKGASLGRGTFENAVVTCPAHGFTVDVRTGRSPRNPLMRVRTFPVVQTGDELTITLGQ
jgi:nitrite reductase/ring-hydroxylating ferredoxin subunit